MSIFLPSHASDLNTEDAVISTGFKSKQHTHPVPSRMQNTNLCKLKAWYRKTFCKSPFTFKAWDMCQLPFKAPQTSSFTCWRKHPLVGSIFRIFEQPWIIFQDAAFVDASFYATSTKIRTICFSCNVCVKRLKTFPLLPKKCLNTKFTYEGALKRK